MREGWNKPKGFKWDSFKNSDGATLRYGHVSPKDKNNTKGTIIILPGFRETAEKYFETINDFLDRGYAVWIMDWRGQGGSERYLPNEPQKAHCEDFDAHIRDLEQFVDKIVKYDKDKPLLINAHSMGGHITLRYLHDNKNKIDGAIVNAPMLDINTGALPSSASKLIAKHAVNSGKATKYVPGGKDWEDAYFKGNKCTTSPTRFKLAGNIFRNNPKLQLGDATYGWLHEAYKSMDILNDEDYLKEIDTPILMLVPKQDEIVSIPAQERAAKLMPKCEIMPLDGAKHESWLEADDIRNLILKKADRFLRTFERKKKLAKNFDKNASKQSSKNNIPPQSLKKLFKYPNGNNPPPPC